MSDFFKVRYSKKEWTISGIILLSIILTAYYFMPSNNALFCNDLRSMKMQKVFGIVKKVYVDKEEHTHRIAEYSTEERGGENKILALTLDGSKLFKILKTRRSYTRRKRFFAGTHL